MNPIRPASREPTDAELADFARRFTEAQTGPAHVIGVNPPPRPRWLWPALAGLAGMIGLALGGIIGAANAGGDPEVPQSCIDAIAAAEEGFGYTGDAMIGVESAFWALGELDDDAIYKAADDIAAATDNLEDLHPRWDAARNECRAAAE